MKTLVYTKGKGNPSAISFFNNKGFLATIPKNTFMSTHVIGWNNQHRWKTATFASEELEQECEQLE